MAPQHFSTAHAGFVVRDMIQAIVAQRQYLSEVDGAIGDGDHGVNMSKGFAQCRDKLDRIESTEPAVSLVEALDALTETLLDGIGGSMGPLYGTFFMTFADEIRHDTQLNRANFGRALHAAIEAVQAVGDAKRGDKTLMDTLLTASDRYKEAVAADASFSICLQALSDGAAEGMESTRPLQARIGRASRLGARSIGVLDAGACSCCFILQSVARSVLQSLAHEHEPEPEQSGPAVSPANAASGAV